MNCIVDLDGVESDSSDDLPDTKYYQVQTDSTTMTNYIKIILSGAAMKSHLIYVI